MCSSASVELSFTSPAFVSLSLTSTEAWDQANVKETQHCPCHPQGAGVGRVPAWQTMPSYAALATTGLGTVCRQ